MSGDSNGDGFLGIFVLTVAPFDDPPLDFGVVDGGCDRSLMAGDRNWIGCRASVTSEYAVDLIFNAKIGQNQFRLTGILNFVNLSGRNDDTNARAEAVRFPIQNNLTLA